VTGDSIDRWHTHLKIQAKKQKLDEILSANAKQENIEVRRNNIFGTGLGSSQARAEERLKEDVDFCEKFLLALQVGVDAEDIITVLKLGKRNTDGGSHIKLPSYFCYMCPLQNSRTSCC